MTVRFVCGRELLAISEASRAKEAAVNVDDMLRLLQEKSIDLCLSLGTCPDSLPSL